jgi:hypothetical protein
MPLALSHCDRRRTMTQTRPEDVDLGKGSHEEQQGGKDAGGPSDADKEKDKSLSERGVPPKAP